MVSAQLILIRHEVDPCTCDRSVQESGSMFLIPIVLIIIIVKQWCAELQHRVECCCPVELRIKS